MDYITQLVPRPIGPPQDASIPGLHPDVLPLEVTADNNRFATALLNSADLAVAREAT